MKKKSQEINAVNALQILCELWMDQMQMTGSVTITKKNGEKDDELESFIANVPC